jgi:uncharacterized protein
MIKISAAGAGLLFGLGLWLSGMTDPAKVIGFLDVGGDWDPALAFVMGGAVGVTLLAFPWVLRRSRPVLAASFTLPASSSIDRRLVVGSVLFGIGWGLAGYCPGPAVASLGSGSVVAVAFVGAMLVGGLLARRPAA